MEIPKANTSDFDYDLPEERIAMHPLENRTSAKLLVSTANGIEDRFIRDVPNLLPSNTCIFVNNTKVVHARLLFPIGDKQIEIFCLSAADGRSLEHALSDQGSSEIIAMVGGARKWKSGALEMDWPIGENSIALKAWKGPQEEGQFRIRLEWNTEHSLAEILQEAGHVPLPPYIGRSDEEEDDERYQTVYAERQGSVAAPTAGLHFDEDLLKELSSKGHQVEELTLHVGAGTFKPISGENAHEHLMHGEEIVVELKTIEKLAELKTPIMAVGTTSMRTLESLYWMGVKAMEGLNPFDGLSQTDAYTFSSHYSREEAFNALKNYLLEKDQTQLRCSTHLYIMPSYSFRVVDLLLTNFHQPRSTLLLLVAAFTGATWRDLYEHALQSDYRFLSYGDAMLLQSTK